MPNMRLSEIGTVSDLGTITPIKVDWIHSFIKFRGYCCLLMRKGLPEDISDSVKGGAFIDQLNYK
jgi:hypothetical protein